MQHPTPFDPRRLAHWSPDKMGKATLFESERVLVGLNGFEPGQEHRLHAHVGMDKIYCVLEGKGALLLDGREERLAPGAMLIAPADVPHGVRNDSAGRLLLLAILCPAPPKR
jgi:quercetin dioxygenase-like cupin family protein